MSWAARRRFLILFTVGAIIAAFIAIISIATLYKAPTCTDGIQNQNEGGADCGGPCPYLCVALLQQPTVLYTKAFTDPTTGRTVVVSSIENKNNGAAAKNVPYRVTVYGANQTLIQSVAGTIDLPPGATMTVFIPSIFSGKREVTDAFLDIDPSTVKWFTLGVDPRTIPGVSNTLQGGTVDMPRVDAVLVNGTVSALNNTQVVAIVRDSRSNIIGSSQTIVPTIPAQGSAPATFTWNTPFLGIPASVEVVPVVPLP